MIESGVDFEGLYDELKGLARRALRGERPTHTLQPTELVHEAWMRLSRAQGAPEEAGDGAEGPDPHFLGLAACTMRRILVDHARARLGVRRSRDRARPLDWDPPDGDDGDAYLVDLGEALEVLAATDERAARVVELRLFGGLSVEETARVIDASPRTVKREWRAGKAWLHRRIAGGDAT